MNYSDKCKIKFTNVRGGDIPDEQYFKIPGVSNSKLKLINPKEGGSPELYKQGFPKFQYNDSLNLGTAVHAAILSENEYKISDYEGKPTGKLGYFIERVWAARKDGKKLIDAIEQASQEANYYSGKLTQKILRNAITQGLDYYLRLAHGEFDDPEKVVLVLNKKQLETARRCIKNLKNNVQVKRFFSENIFEDKTFLNEMAFFSDIEITFPNGDKHVLTFKGKIDNGIVDPETKTVYLNDIKTTSRPIGHFMDKVIDGESYAGVFTHHHYFRQMADYQVVMQMYCREVLGLTDYNYKCNMLVVETTGNNEAQVFPVSNAYIQAGIAEFKDLICRVAYMEHYNTMDLSIFDETNN